MPSINADYLNGSSMTVAEIGKPENTLREVLRLAREKGFVFGYGVLKLDNKVQSLADLDKRIGKTSLIQFSEMTREQPIDLDSL